MLHQLDLFIHCLSYCMGLIKFYFSIIIVLYLLSYHYHSLIIVLFTCHILIIKSISVLYYIYILETVKIFQ